MAVIVEGSTIHLTGSVGFDWFEDSFSHAEVLMALAEVGSGADISIHLNSPGGYTDQAEGIANSIRLRSGKTNIVVTGVCMSAATIIACAGDDVAMCAGAMWMIHEPHVSILFADIDGVQSAAKYQQLVAATYVELYSARTGKDESEIRSLMKATTYFDADETVAFGFASRKTDQTVDFVDVAPAYPYADPRMAAHAPERLVARARQKNWTLKASRPPGRDPEPEPKPQETVMTDKERADALAAELAQLKAAQGADVQKERDDELAALRAEKATRENADAILALDEAQGRTAQAQALAAAGVKAADAKTILAASAKESAAPERRLNGEGLRPSASNPRQNTTSRAAGTTAMTANMRKLLGQKETA